MKKHILILNTGGTISSIKTDQGYEPALGYVEAALAQIPALKHADMPDYTIKEYHPLLDSSNMTVSDWNRIANDIADNYFDFDGFIVFHGTDTMAYTASALSFMLENLAKPVIVTGSQIPLSEVRNDAVDNIITSLWLCEHQSFNEVCIYFNQKLLRGNRTQKISAQRFNAFDSPNYPHLATIGITIELNKEFLLGSPHQTFRLQTITPQFIANFRLFPGFATDVLAYILQQPIRGLILETYGAGNAQNNDSRFLQLIEEACKRGIIIINCTQCQEGRVEMSQYATGYTLKLAGLISGHDMTPEAAHCKLLYLFSKNLNVQKVKQLMETNLCGELSLSQGPVDEVLLTLNKLAK
ncbi:asparaginase [Legionella fairfieldensis]|uniref:asparaginase n=1 Tax=Legionella fairfieldensis TaxID=45064 RepID=UPI000686CCF6|nr:asparaginase [Legionella fairfieldensis]